MLSDDFKVAIMQELRELIREELETALAPKPLIRELPYLLTKDQLMELFHMKSTKASKLLARADFPKIRDAGHVLIPSKQLLQWIDEHTEWVSANTTYFQKLGDPRKPKKVAQ